MDQEIKWLKENIKRVINDLTLSLDVKVVVNGDEDIDNVDVVFLPIFRRKLFNASLVERIKNKRIVVANNRVKDKLIEKGCSGKNIAVCSFWGPNIVSYEVRPAIINKHLRQIDNSESWLVTVSKLQRTGGIGVVRTHDDCNIHIEFLLYLLAGIPVVVPDTSAMSELVKKYHLGTCYSTIEELERIQIEDNNYVKWSRNSAKIGQMIANGEFIKQVLIEQFAQYQLEKTNVANRKPRYGIVVMDSLATLDYIAQHKCSVARLGDGEISLLLGTAQVFQKEDAELQKRLDQIVKKASNEKLLVCLSDTFHDLDRYTPSAQNWWKGHLNIFKDYYQQLGGMSNVYGNTMVTRPYMDLQDRSSAAEIFRRIKLWWNNRDILIVEGKYTRSGVNNDLYNNAKSIQRIICPSKNAWEKYGEIEQAIRRYGKGKLVLVMLGMTATVIAADLADWGQVIDLGHLDPEYEWYKMGATKRIPIPGKHTAEMNYDQGVPQDIDDPKYLSEIILNLS